MFRKYLIFIYLFLSTVYVSYSQELEVAIKETPPFAMKNSAGEWQGLSVDLWRDIAAKAGLDYTLEETDLAGMLDGVANGQYDAAISAITMNSQREERMDFSHSYYSSGLGIAVRESSDGLNWLAVAKAFFSWQFASALIGLLIILLAAGFAIWVFERKTNQEQFGGEKLKGIGDGFWWSAVTMTTVGYGDKSPVTLGGRIVALIWMFTSVIVISSFTASIATSLTVGSISDEITGASDLQGRKVGTIKSSTSVDFLDSAGAKPIAFDTMAEAFEELRNGRLKAVAYDKDLMRYQLRKSDDIKVLNLTLQPQDYAIAMNVDPEILERVNRALLETLESGRREDIKAKYDLSIQ
ncbi:transporter substrate-binding domain-containing protein [Pelagicoccus albus]|uniref:Transporter substrate-binding domain-containing protein n=1 Tax=Pelagicoccus albus TaxID=415222 RepID=A0A7X1B571_9BACT|nr:transporter substrate-binding domain-containing protein [Pelagicoccus albus]MBC2604768.1 transporter substrate-binding domain-containing protein [Pelagicoccus albus]